MKVSKLEMVIAFLVAVLVLTIAYSIYMFYIPIYFGSLLLIVSIVYLLGLIIIERELKGSLEAVKSLASSMEQWIRNEDIRRDLEALPFFIEEKRREFIKGLMRGYDDISEITERLDRIRSEIERMHASMALSVGINDIFERNTNKNPEIFSEKLRAKVNQRIRKRPYNYWRIRRNKKLRLNEF